MYERMPGCFQYLALRVKCHGYLVMARCVYGNHIGKATGWLVGVGGVHNRIGWSVVMIGACCARGIVGCALSGMYGQN